jgi:hypothetical protein
MLDLKGAQVKIDLHLELTLETGWHSTRAPAGATSTKLESPGRQHHPGFIENTHLRLRNSLLAFREE